MNIRSDDQFKKALQKLPLAEQRRVAARFVEHVSDLSRDPRVRAAITAVTRGDASDEALEMAIQVAKRASVESYTQCGKLGDWMCQAGHFVAEAARSCVSPAESGHNIAWDTAMHARVARTCETIAKGRGTENSEAEMQYRILDENLRH